MEFLFPLADTSKLASVCDKFWCESSAVFRNWRSLGCLLDLVGENAKLGGDVQVLDDVAVICGICMLRSISF